MTTTTNTDTLIVDREVAQPLEKVWRALTQSPLIEQWLMKNDFQPIVGHKFNFTADWGVVEGKVLTVEQNKMLSYTWESLGLESVVTWTLAPTAIGTQINMKQTGFRPDQQQAYQGAAYGWNQFLGALEQVVAKLD